MIVFGLLLCCGFLMVGGQPSANRPTRWQNRPMLGHSSRSFGRGQPQRWLEPTDNNNNNDNDNNEDEEDDERTPPQNWRQLMTEGDGVHSVDDFIRLLDTPEGRQVTDNDIFSPYETQDGKRFIIGGGIMATSDECSPRNMSVRLPLNYSDNQIAYYPECTMVQRCGGCTPTQFLSCQPRYKEKIVLKVLRARYLYPGALRMQWEGFSSVEVERHLSCRAVCTLNPQDCGRHRRFNRYQCKCYCRRFGRCSNHQVWDDETCMCRCPNQRPCCAEDGGEDERTCSFYFDHDFCECTLKEAIGAAPNASQAEIDHWLASRNRGNQHGNGDSGNVFFPSTTTPTTTTTTTTIPTTTSDPCAGIGCPWGFIKVFRRHTNRCVCQLRFRPGGRLGRG